MKRGILIAVFLVLTHALQAQPLQFRHLTVNDGLTQNSASVMTFDRQGYLWVGTADGLNRYDGYSFIQYRKSGARDSRLFNTGINELACDREGVIWIAGTEGLEVFDPVRNTHRTLLSLPLQANMTRFWYDSTHAQMFVFIQGQAVLSYDIHTFKSRTVVPQNAGTVNSMLFSLSVIHSASNNELYLIPRGRNKYIRLNTGTGAYSQHAFTADPADMVTSTSTPYGKDHIVFTALIGKKFKLAEYDLRNERFTRIRDADQKADDPFYKSSCFIPSLQQFVVSDYSRGLTFYDTAFNETANYPTSTVLSGTVRGMITLSMLLKDDCLWLGSDPNGITYCDLSPQLFHHFRNNNNSQLPIVKGIFTDSHENVYSCYLASGADVFDRNGNYLRDLEPIGANGNETLQLHAFNSLLPGGKDSVLIYSTNFYGFYEPLTKHHSNFMGQLMQAAHADRNTYNTFHQTCMITPGRFLNSFNRYIWLAEFRSGKLKLTLKDSLDKEVSALFAADDDHILAGSEAGLFSIVNGVKKFFRETGTILIKQINRDAKGDYWISTVNGLWQLGPQLEVKQHYTTDNGLPNNYIYGSIISGDHLWISTNYGLSRMDLSGHTFTNYTIADGLQSNEFNSGAFWKAANGKLYFGGVNGVTEIDESIQRPGAIHFPVSVNRILVNEKELSLDPAVTGRLELDHTQNNIVLQFAGIFPSRSRLIRYRYKLEGADKEWVYPATERSVRYAGLTPGHYTFHVAASLQPGDWSNETSISIHIKPPFWATVWFRTGIILIALVLLWFLIRRINEVRYRKQLEKIRVQQQLEDERRRISRDLHDNIGAYTSALMANVEKMKAKSGLDDDLSKMQNNAEQILSSLRETIWVLNNKEISVADFSDGFKNHCSKLLRNFEHISFEAEENITENRTLSASRAIHLNRILQEALQNMIRHSAATSIRFSISSTDALRMGLSDNGKGFDPMLVKRGNGLDNMEWRAHEAGMRLHLESEPGKGSRIILEDEMLPKGY